MFSLQMHAEMLRSLCTMHRAMHLVLQASGKVQHAVSAFNLPWKPDNYLLLACVCDASIHDANHEIL